MITDLSPAVLGHEVNARPIKPRRVPDPARAADPAVPAHKVTRDPVDGMLTRDELARGHAPRNAAQQRFPQVSPQCA